MTPQLHPNPKQTAFHERRSAQSPSLCIYKASEFPPVLVEVAAATGVATAAATGMAAAAATAGTAAGITAAGTTTVGTTATAGAAAAAEAVATGPTTVDGAAPGTSAVTPAQLEWIMRVALWAQTGQDLDPWVEQELLEQGLICHSFASI